MHLHVHVHHWIKVWLLVGLVCCAVALTNILGRHLSDGQAGWVMAVVVMNWVIAGLICYSMTIT